MAKTQKRQKYLKKNLIFLSCDRGIHISKKCPEGVTFDLVKGTWMFEKDPHSERRGPFKIGTDTRFVERNHQWGPIGAYDMTRFQHIETMLFEALQHSSRDCIDVDD